MGSVVVFFSPSLLEGCARSKVVPPGEGSVGFNQGAHGLRSSPPPQSVAVGLSVFQKTLLTCYPSRYLYLLVWQGKAR